VLEVLLAGEHGSMCRAFLSEGLPDMVDRLVQSYGALASEARIPDVVAAWGMMPGAEYAAALTLAAERDYRPRLTELGFEPAALACFDRPPLSTPRA
jgi:hypothetical protein